MKYFVLRHWQSMREKLERQLRDSREDSWRSEQESWRWIHIIMDGQTEWLLELLVGAIKLSEKLKNGIPRQRWLEFWPEIPHWSEVYLPIIGFRLIRMSSQTRKSSLKSNTGSVTSRWLRSFTSTSPRPWRARRTWTTSLTFVGRPKRAAPDSRTWGSASSGLRRSSTLSQNWKRFALQKEQVNKWLEFGCYFSLSGNKCLKTLSKDTVISSYLQHISERELFGMNRGCFQTVSDFKPFFAAILTSALACGWTSGQRSENSSRTVPKISTLCNKNVVFMSKIFMEM